MIYHILGHPGVQAYRIMAIMSLWLVGSRAVHESVRVGFVPNPLPDHLGSPKNGSAADGNNSGGRTSKFSGRFSVGLGLCESCQIFTEICLFLLDLTGFRRDLS